MKTISNMKNILTAGVFAIAMLSAASLRAQSADKPELSVPLTDPTKPYKLNVNLTSGSITVSSYEGKTINISVQTAEEKKTETARPDGLRRISSTTNADVRASVDNNEVTVRTNSQKNDLVIMIPHGQASLKLRTINNGDIIVNNVSADMEITNTNGSIKMTGVSGSVVASTINGGIKVGFKTIDVKAPMAFTSLNGTVDVTFPATFKSNMKVRSDRGDVFTDFDMVTEQRKPVITNENKAGTYNLKIDDWIYGKIGGGGPEVLMKTSNGSIYIRKTK